MSCAYNVSVTDEHEKNTRRFRRKSNAFRPKTINGTNRTCNSADVSAADLFDRRRFRESQYVHTLKNAKHLFSISSNTTIGLSIRKSRIKDSSTLNDVQKIITGRMCKTNQVRPCSNAQILGLLLF